MGKCRDEHVDNVSLCPSSKNEKYYYKRDYANILDNKYFLGLEIKFKKELKDKIYLVSVKDLIEKGKPNALNVPEENILIKLLGRCHAAAHIEKEEAKD